MIAGALGESCPAGSAAAAYLLTGESGGADRVATLTVCQVPYVDNFSFRVDGRSVQIFFLRTSGGRYNCR
jgi:hypothetical protein